MNNRFFLLNSPLVLALCLALLPFKKAHAEAPPISHSYAMFGNTTQIVSASGEVLWKYPAATRDGWVLPNGNLLLTLSKNKDYPGGAVLEVTRENQVVFEFKGTQSEVNTSALLENGNVLLSEAGNSPRILEVDRNGKILKEVPLQCQTSNHHMQSRMARKLPNGNYLVPQLHDKVVREYTPKGEVVWEFKTPEEPKDSWPFTAIRLPNGNTLVTLTHGNAVAEVDPAGKVVWHLSNEDLPDFPLKDPCGAQWLPNGNIVITSYAAKGNAIKLFEVNREKTIVWQMRDGLPGGIHEFQILDEKGNALPGIAYR